ARAASQPTTARSLVPRRRRPVYRACSAGRRAAFGAQPLVRLGQRRQERLDGGRQAAPLGRIGRRHRRARDLKRGRGERAQPLAERHAGEAAQALERRARIGHQLVIVDDAQPLGVARLQIVERRAVGRLPLVRRDLFQRPPVERAPAGRQEQRPRRAAPARQRRARDEPAAAPRLDDAAQVLRRRAIQEDDARVGKRGQEERHAQRVLRRLLDEAHLARAIGGREVEPARVVARAQLGEKRGVQRGDVLRRRVGGGQAIRLEAAPIGGQRRHALDHAVTLVADGPRLVGRRQQLEQERAPRARRGDDEDRLHQRAARRQIISIGFEMTERGQVLRRETRRVRAVREQEVQSIVLLAPHLRDRSAERRARQLAPLGRDWLRERNADAGEPAVLARWHATRSWTCYLNTMDAGAWRVKADNLRRAFAHYRARETQLSSLPFRFILELTQNCNYKCFMCAQAWEPKYQRFDAALNMPLDTFVRSAEQLFPTAIMVDLHGFGETTILPHWPDVVDYLARWPFIEWNLVTNLSLTRDDVWDKMIALDFRLGFSCDGASKQTFE